MNTPLSRCARFLALFLCANGIVSPGRAAEKADATSAGKKTAEMKKLLNELEVETRAFQGMPLAEFVKTVVKQFPKDKKVTLRIDAGAFGKDYVALAKSPVTFQPFPKRMKLRTALRLIRGRIDVAIDYLIEPTGIVITTPDGALFTLPYDIRDILEKWDSLRTKLSSLQAMGGLVDLGETKLPGKAGALVQLLLAEVSPESWQPTRAAHGTIQVHNGTRLVVRTNGETHEHVDSFLMSLRRLADLAVVMNARVVEVDCPFYAEHIRPLLLVPGGPVTGSPQRAGPDGIRTLVPIGAALEALLHQQKLIGKDDGIKLVNGLKSAFLSLHNPFTYATNPGDARAEPVYRAANDGFSVRAHVAVSPDRRRVRLKITQKVAQVVEVKKTEAIDLATGKRVTVDSPHMRESSLSGTIDVDDGQAVLMPVAYRPGDKGRVWVLVARPTIYIEEEEKEIRRLQAPPGPSKKEKQKGAGKTTALPSAGPTAKPVPADISAWKAHDEAGRSALLHSRYADAERELTAALKEAEKLPATDPRLTETLVNLAAIHLKRGVFGNADRLCLRAEALMERNPGSQQLLLARSFNLRAEAYVSLGAVEEAEKLARRALAIREKLLGKDHPDVAASLETLVAMGRENRSVAAHCLRIREKALGNHHPSLIVSLLLLARRVDDADKHIQRAVAIVRRAHGQNHPDMAECLTGQAILYREQEKYQRAIDVQQEALRIWKETLGANHPSRGIGLRNLVFIARLNNGLPMPRGTLGRPYAASSAA